MARKNDNIIDVKNEQTEKIIKTVSIIIALAVLILFCANDCFYTLGENTQAVVTTLGKPEVVSEPGLHVKWPFIQDVQKVNTEIQGLEIGYKSEGSSSEWVTNESQMITSDYNFVNIDFYISYQISDPIAAIYTTTDAKAVLKNMAQNCIRTVIASHDVDSVLTSGKVEIQAEIKEMLMNKLEEYQIGIQLKDISIQDAEPPTTEVASAFKAVETAKQGKETALNNANKYKNEKIPGAEAEADRVLQDAEAQKTAKINEATAQAARFNALYDEYKKYPLITKKRMFYEAIEELLPDVKVIIKDKDTAVQTLLPLEEFAGSSQSGEEGNN